MKPHVKHNLMIGFGIIVLVDQIGMILFSLIRHHHLPLFYILNSVFLGWSLFNVSERGKARIERRNMPLHVVPQPDSLE